MGETWESLLLHLKSTCRLGFLKKDVRKIKNLWEILLFLVKFWKIRILSKNQCFYRIFWISRSVFEKSEPRGRFQMSQKSFCRFSQVIWTKNDTCGQFWSCIEVRIRVFTMGFEPVPSYYHHCSSKVKPIVWKGVSSNPIRCSKVLHCVLPTFWKGVGSNQCGNSKVLHCLFLPTVWKDVGSNPGRCSKVLHCVFIYRLKSRGFEAQWEQ